MGDLVTIYNNRSTDIVHLVNSTFRRGFKVEFKTDLNYEIIVRPKPALSPH